MSKLIRVSLVLPKPGVTWLRWAFYLVVQVLVRRDPAFVKRNLVTLFRNQLAAKS
jgi:hypothetical protein